MIRNRPHEPEFLTAEKTGQWIREQQEPIQWRPERRHSTSGSMAQKLLFK